MIETDDIVGLTSLVAMLVGGWCVLGFVFRLGFISEFLSRPILAGYVFGSGIIIVVSQLEALFGLQIDTTSARPTWAPSPAIWATPTGSPP